MHRWTLCLPNGLELQCQAPDEGSARFKFKWMYGENNRKRRFPHGSVVIRGVRTVNINFV